MNYSKFLQAYLLIIFVVFISGCDAALKDVSGEAEGDTIVSSSSETTETVNAETSNQTVQN